jgi:prepilin-type N-terminal cleavage/methylation domain-containing protein
MRNNHKNQKGFSLVELLIASALLTMLVTMVSQVYFVVGNSWTKYMFAIDKASEQAIIQLKLRRTIESATLYYLTADSHKQTPVFTINSTQLIFVSLSPFFGKAKSPSVVLLENQPNEEGESSLVLYEIEVFQLKQFNLPNVEKIKEIGLKQTLFSKLSEFSFELVARERKPTLDNASLGENSQSDFLMSAFLNESLDNMKTTQSYSLSESGSLPGEIKLKFINDQQQYYYSFPIQEDSLFKKNLYNSMNAGGKL